MNKTFFAVFAVCVLTFSAFAQSKEQRDAAKQWPLTLRVNPEQGESKSTKSGNVSGRRNGKQVKKQEKSMRWTAQIDCRATNFTEKVELKCYYIGTRDGDFSIIDTNAQKVQLNEKGRATVDIKSPTATLVKTVVQRGSRRNRSTKSTVKGERINGLIAQLLVNGTIVKTYTSQPVWAKGAWTNDLTEDDIRPGAKKK